MKSDKYTALRIYGKVRTKQNNCVAREYIWNENLLHDKKLIACALLAYGRPTLGLEFSH